MRYLFLIIFFILAASVLTGQNSYESIEGKVSYVTTQSIYIKFQSTDKIRPGDTLFQNREGILVPVVTVREISSISCVCIPLNSNKLSVGDQVISRQKLVSEAKKKEEVIAPAAPLPPTGHDSVNTPQVKPAQRVQSISGNLSVASNLNFSNASANTERMKYTFAMAIRNIGNSKLSAETNMTFAHKLGEWTEVQNDIFNGLKIYSFALNYDFNSHHRILFGRKINPRISNVGAIDGLQYEYKTGSFSLGLIAGSRPDNINYSVNPELIQYGGYAGHDLAGKNGSMQTTIAFINQMNNGKTDRRFTYLQHTNSLVRNLYFFGSVEVDLYKKTMNQTDSVTHDTSYSTDNSPTLSNLYLSLRYRPFRKLSLSVSYSSRQNVIYYETYKSLVDRLLEAATVQGFTFQVNYQPVTNLSVGVNAGFRDSKTDPRPSKNLYGFITWGNVPGIKATSTLSVTILETSYMSGQIYSLGVTRDLVPGKLSAGLSYRYVSYKFYSGETSLGQNMGEINMTWRILKKLSCGLYYEGTFDNASTFNRIYINITQRF